MGRVNEVTASQYSACPQRPEKCVSEGGVGDWRHVVAIARTVALAS
jgi:hypothetical protein